MYVCMTGRGVSVGHEFDFPKASEFIRNIPNSSPKSSEINHVRKTTSEQSKCFCLRQFFHFNTFHFVIRFFFYLTKLIFGSVGGIPMQFNLVIIFVLIKLPRDH